MSSSNVDKILELGGTNNKYQYILLFVSFISWANTMLTAIGLPFLEKVPDISYRDPSTSEIIHTQLSYEICNDPSIQYNITNTYEYSFVISTGIECDQIKTGLIGTTTYFGNFLGSLLFNFIADTKGRKNTFILSNVLYLIFTFLFNFANDYYSIIVLLFLSNIFAMVINFSCLVLIEETTSTKIRGIFGTIVNAGFPSCALFYFPLFSYLGKWKYVFQVNALTALVVLIIFYLFGYESPRLLISQGKIDEAIDIVKNLAKFHNMEKKFNQMIQTAEYKEIINELREGKREDEEKMNNNKAKEEGSILSLIKYRSIRYKFLILCFLGFCVNGSYNGISISIKKLPGDLFQNGMLFYVFEVIVGFFSGCMINTKFFGRKGTILIFYFIAFVSFFVFLFFDNVKEFKILIVLVCKFSISSIFTILYPYILENYPTSIRAIGLGITTSCDNIGGMVFPLITELLTEKQLYIVLATLNFFEFFFMLFMPETYGKHLPETIREMEESDNTLKENELKMIN